MHGFGDGHEVAAHVGVGDGDRASGGDLPLEAGNHAAAAAQHVAKPHHRKRALGAVGGIQHNQFCDALRCAVHAGGANRLVGGDHHQPLHAVGHRSLDDDTGAEDVVGHRFFHVDFHQRDMLVRRGVEDHLGLQIGKNVLDAVLVADVGDDGMQRQGGEGILQFQQGLENAVFTVPEEDQRRGAPAGDLAAEFRADGAARACDKHPLAAQGDAHLLVVNPGRGTAQQVIDVDFPQAVDTDLAADQFVHARHGAEGDVLLAAMISNFAHHVPRCGGDGDDHLVDAAAGDDARQIVEGAHHRDTVDLQFLLGFVVIEEADQFQVELRVALDFAGHQGTGIPRADDGNPVGVTVHHLGGRRGAGFSQQAGSEAQAPHQKEREQPVDQQHNARETDVGAALHLGVNHHQDAQREEQGGCGDRRENQHQLAGAGIRPNPAIKPEKVVNQGLDEQGKQHHPPGLRQVKPKQSVELKAQRETPQHSHGNQEQITQQEQPVAHGRLVERNFCKNAPQFQPLAVPGSFRTQITALASPTWSPVCAAKSAHPATDCGA